MTELPVPPSIVKLREQKAYRAGYHAGWWGANRFAHPWAGKQSNFSRPLENAWDKGYRDGRDAKIAAALSSFPDSTKEGE